MGINGHEYLPLEDTSEDAIRDNMHRRQMTPSQVAIVSARIAPPVAKPPKAAKIQHTTNYEIFQKNTFNRDVSKVDALLLSMRKHGFIPAYAIHVTKGENGKLIVKGGHHRLEAARRLGIAVYYIICEDDASVCELEQATTPWAFRDYVYSYSRSGSAPHIAITEYCERTGISMQQAASMLAGESAGSGNTARKVKDGSYRLKDNSHAEAVASIVIELRKMRVRFATHQCFVSALSSCVWLEEFNAEVFLRRVAANLHLMARQATTAQYLELIDLVYNYKAHEKIALGFLAREAAKSRNAVNKGRKKKTDQREEA